MIYRIADLPRFIVGIMLSLILFGAQSGEQPPLELLRKHGMDSGLCVIVGNAGTYAETIASSGHFIVEALTPDENSANVLRSSLETNGLYGVATANRWLKPPTLPYADNLVNVILIHRPTLKDIPLDEAEIQRVLAPGGTALFFDGTEWNRTAKTRPVELDVWTHFDHGADGNGVSSDKVVKQPTQLQWISGLQNITMGGNPAGFTGLTGLRVTERTVVFDVVPEAEKNSQRVSMLYARDAYNGAPLWKIQRDFEAGRRRWQLLAGGGKIFTLLKRDGHITALSERTGKVLKTYDSIPPVARKTEENTQLRYEEGRLYANVDDTLYVVDAESGALIWKHTEADSTILIPCISAASKRVLFAAGAPSTQFRSRWPWTEIRAVACLDLATGKQLWRNTDVAGKPVGQIVASGDTAILFCGSAIGGRGEKEGGGWIGSVALADGKTGPDGTFKSAWNDSMYNVLVRDNVAWYAGHTSIFRFDPRDGSITRSTRLNYNQRCNRFCATNDWFIWGYVTYLDRNFNGTLQSAARAGCALGATPANGMLYFTPNACHCFTQLRGYMALSPETLHAPWKDSERLRADGPATVRRDVRPSKAPGQIEAIVSEWSMQSERKPVGEAPALQNGAVIYRTFTHEHRVEASENGKTIWSFTAGGRIGAAPVLENGHLIFGSHDGWVYALRTGDGALAWRFMVAPYERRILAHGQLESSWPVHGVCLLNGAVWASAGSHPELGGGVYVWALDPASGAIVSQRILQKSPARIESNAGKASGSIVPHSFLNAPIKAEGNNLKIENYIFDPRQPNEALKAMLETPIQKK